MDLEQIIQGLKDLSESASALADSLRQEREEIERRHPEFREHQDPDWTVPGVGP